MNSQGQRHAPATLRNRDAIVAVLETILPDSGLVLEIASGTGEHAVYFGQHFPHLTFQPSDAEPENLGSISAWTAREALTNIRPPLLIDTTGNWGIDAADVIICINMIHISPWEATIGLFTKAAQLLPAGAPLYLYGPYIRAEVETAPSNLAFERSLKSRNLQWGLRDVADIDALAEKTNFVRESLTEMPANNISLVYRRN